MHEKAEYEPGAKDAMLRLKFLDTQPKLLILLKEVDTTHPRS